MKKLRIALEWLTTGVASLALLAFALWMAAPRLLGWTPEIVLSGSMEPALPAGSVAFAAPVAPDNVRVGDVITFRHPDNPGMLVSHRVVAVVSTDAGLAFRTKGDANEAEDSWIVQEENLIGRIRWHVPYLGHVASRVQTPAGFVALVGLPAALIVAGELRTIVRELRSRRRTEGAA